MVADLSGAASPEFGATAEGFQAAVALINSQGGVNGKQISVKTYDAQTSASGATAATESALSSNAIGFLYSVISTEYQASYPSLASASQPSVLVGDYDPAFYPTSQRNQFTLWTTDPQIVGAYVGEAKQLLGSLSGKRIAFIGPDTPADETQLSELNRLGKLDGFSVTSSLTGTTITDFTAGAAKLAQAKPNAICFVLVGSALSTVTRALTAAGLNVPLIANEVDAGAAQFGAVNLPNFYAYRTAVATAPGDNMTTQANKSGFTSGLSTGFWPDGWSAAYVLAAALKSCGANCSSAGLTSALEQVHNLMPPESGLAPYSFSPTDHKGLSGVQFFNLDPSSKKVVAVGQIVNIAGS